MKAVLCWRVVAVEPNTARRLQQIVRANNIRIDKRGGTGDRPIHVRLGRKMHDRVNVFLTQECLNHVPIDDVAFHESIIIVAGHGLQAGKIARVRERIENDESILRVPGRPLLHEIRANESGAAGDE